MILFFIFCYRCSFSQISFENDSSYFPYQPKTYLRIDSMGHLNKDVDFEYRLWVSPALKYKHYLFIISLKEEKWGLRWFEYGWKQVQDSSFRDFAERKPFNNNIKSLVAELEKNEFLKIPAANDVKDSTGKIADVAALDGVFFSFELISKENKRAYFYHCPEYNMKEYPYIKTFQQVINIIKAIFRYCGLGDFYICSTNSMTTNC